MREDDSFYVVWKDGGGAPTHRHESEASARREADRLARAHGGRFYVLCAISFVEKNDVRVVTLRRDAVLNQSRKPMPGEPFPKFRARVDRALSAHERRLNDIDAELIEQHQDIVALTDLCLRAKRRLRSRLAVIARRKRRGVTGRES